MFKDITQVSFFNELKFSNKIDDLQKAKIFYYVECLRYLAFKYEKENTIVFEATSKKVKDNCDLKQFLLEHKRMDDFVENLKNQIINSQFPKPEEKMDISKETEIKSEFKKFGGTSFPGFYP